jgi:RNA polymerase sigma factor (sigma-70 family)
MTDAELLEAYATRRSDSAFSELVSRYVNLVYAVALRQVRDAHLAEDVAQAVFLVLARKAGSIGSNVIMAGWLFRTTRFVAARALRTEARRRHHEVEAAIMNQQISSSEPDEAAWREIAPHLDEAIATLPQKDRDAVLLRFFETQPMRVVGQRLALTEDAAKKRVSRALEKLKQVLLRRGIALSGAAIAAGLGRNGTQAAPAGLTNRILAAHAGGIGSATTSALVTAALRQLLWLKTRVPLAFGGAIVAAMLLLRGLMGPSVATSTPTAMREAVRNADVPTQTPADAKERNNPTTNAPAIAAANVFRLHIRDAADNAPIVGARVIWDSWQTLQADTNGICELPMPTQEFETVRVWVSAEEYVPKVIEWKSYELKGSGATYTTKLQRGLVIQGVVEDEPGQPISGASISFLGPGISMIERENVGFHPSLSTVKTDESGRFVSHQMPSRTGLGLGLVVHAASFAPQCLPVAIPEGLSTNWVIVLNHGVSLAGRVLTKAADPISGARVVAEEPHGGVEIAASTDAEGNFKLEHLPLGSASLKAGAAGYDNLTQSVLVESNAAPVIFQLNPAGPPGEPLARMPNPANRFRNSGCF